MAQEIQSSTLNGHILLTQIRSTHGRNANTNTPDTINIVASILKSLNTLNAKRLEWWWSEPNRSKRQDLKDEIDKEARREKYERGDAKEDGKCRKTLQAMQSINTKAKNQIIAM
jgi:hypothetical protein